MVLHHNPLIFHLQTARHYGQTPSVPKEVIPGTISPQGSDPPHSHVNLRCSLRLLGRQRPSQVASNLRLVLGPVYGPSLPPFVNDQLLTATWHSSLPEDPGTKIPRQTGTSHCPVHSGASTPTLGADPRCFRTLNNHCLVRAGVQRLPWELILDAIRLNFVWTFQLPLLPARIVSDFKADNLVFSNQQPYCLDDDLISIVSVFSLRIVVSYLSFSCRQEPLLGTFQIESWVQVREMNVFEFVA